MCTEQRSQCIVDNDGQVLSVGERATEKEESYNIPCGAELELEISVSIYDSMNWYKSTVL